MKKTAATSFRNCCRVCAVTALFAFATVGTAFADNISKTFEFGAGTPQPRSHMRTFPIPCGTIGGVAAVVKFQRLGPNGASNDIPIIIELREPDTAPEQEGPIAETKNATAKKTEQTVTLRSESSNRGCSLPWRVRVKYAIEGTPSVQAFGTIRLDFDGRQRDFFLEGASGKIAKGSSVTGRIGDSGGFDQGRIDLTGQWIHDLFMGIPGPNPIRLKVQLIDPNGTIVKTAEGFADREHERNLGLPIMRLTYQFANHASGQWKMKITNLNPNDNAEFLPRPKFTPGCP